MPKKDVSEFFSSYAHDFSAIYGSRHTFLNRYVNRWLRRSMRIRYLKTLEGCSPVEGRTVIDIGCGPGHYSIALAKAGAKRVVGLDFAEGMLALAAKSAADAGVADRCEFLKADFMACEPPEKFDYAILMGFMDYMAEPRRTVEKVLSLARSKAFFSFPKKSGPLAWQRRVRYRWKCDLFMYDPPQIRELFAGLSQKSLEIEKIGRDYFVTACMD